MSYLTDPWIWLCIGLGFGVATSCVVLTYLLGIYTAGPDCKMSPYLAITLQIAYLVYLAVALDFGWRISGHQPYTLAYSVGYVSSIPMMFWVSHKFKARGIKFG
jgi:hypothetical protein